MLRLIALGLSLVIAAMTGAGMMAEWSTLALYWYAPTAASTVDPIFGRSLTFYFFTLPAWQLLTGWLLTLAVMAGGIALAFIAIAGGGRILVGRDSIRAAGAWRGLSISFAVVLLMLAARVYLGRFERLFADHTIFSGVTYTDAHVTLTGMLVVVGALVVGAAIALVNAVSAPRVRWLVLAIAPAVVCYVAVGLVGAYVNSFIVKPNELVREQPYITNNIELTRQAYALDRIAQHSFPAETGVEAVDVANNQETLQNIRLWDWRALQDTLRQIQEIRTYYDFPDIDIDRYEINGSVRQMMLATRELNVDRLPESSRNWINEKLIYTHGYGVTMNPVNGFTPEGLPALILKQHAGSNERAVHQRDAAGNLFRRADQHRRLRAHASAGIQLPAGRDQQRHVVRGHRRHRARRVSAPHPHRARPRRPDQAPVQRRHHRRQPPADAAQLSASA